MLDPKDSMNALYQGILRGGAIGIGLYRSAPARRGRQQPARAESPALPRTAPASIT